MILFQLRETMHLKKILISLVLFGCSSKPLFVDLKLEAKMNKNNFENWCLNKSKLQSNLSCEKSAFCIKKNYLAPFECYDVNKDSIFYEE